MVELKTGFSENFNSNVECVNLRMETEIVEERVHGCNFVNNLSTIEPNKTENEALILAFDKENKPGNRSTHPYFIWTKDIQRLDNSFNNPLLTQLRNTIPNTDWIRDFGGDALNPLGLSHWHSSSLQIYPFLISSSFFSLIFGFISFKT